MASKRILVIWACLLQLRNNRCPHLQRTMLSPSHHRCASAAGWNDNGTGAHTRADSNANMIMVMVANSFTATRQEVMQGAKNKKQKKKPYDHQRVNF